MTYLKNIELESIPFSDLPEAETSTSEPPFLDSIHDLEEELDSEIDVA